MTDAELLATSSEEPEAFGVFYDRHVRAVLAFLQRRTWDGEIAAELTAETFAAAFFARARYRDVGESARAWLYGIARRKLARTFRSKGIDDRARRKLGLEWPALDEDSLERIETLADLEPLKASLRAALSKIPKRQATAVELRVAHDLPYVVVAQRVGCSEGAARVLVARGLARLAELMEVQ